MKIKTRRIEIIASGHSVAIVDGDASASIRHEAASLMEIKSWDATVEPDSEEGRRLIIETIDMLEEIIGSR
jgi:hypothetical protein